MSNIRRWYFYIICAISLQAVTWAAIALLRNILLGVFSLGGLVLGDQIQMMAFQIAVIVVGLPLFISHWRWATRSEADRADDDHLRLLYLYVMLSAFLLPLAFNLRGLLEAALRLLVGLGAPISGLLGGDNRASLVAALAAVLVLGLLALFFARLLREEQPSVPKDPVPATLQQLFLLLFSAIGLGFTAQGAYTLLRQLLVRPPGPLSGFPDAPIAAVAQLTAGLALWLPFWHAAQRTFRRGGLAGGAALARKSYLYLVVLIALLTAVSSAAVLLTGILRAWFGLPSRESGGGVLAALLVALVLLLYHALVLREDAQASGAAAEGAAVRRLFWYLLAAVGLLATLVGLGGVISVAISALTQPVQSGMGANALREQLTSFLAVLIAGLPLWLLAWRQVQAELDAPPPQGTPARASEVRRLYLYGFILLATLTFLGCAVYLVAQLLSALLGEALPPNAAADMARAGAFGLLAVLVWLYHGRLLREDNSALEAAAPLAGEVPRLVILEDGDGRFASQLATALAAAYPGATMHIVPLGENARAALSVPEDEPPAAALLQQAGIIISPWTAITPYAGPSLPLTELGAAFASSAAHKLIVPFALPGWDWSGLEAANMDTAVDETVEAVSQLVTGQPLRPRRALGAGRLLLLLLGVFFLLGFLLILLSGLLPFLGLD